MHDEDAQPQPKPDYSKPPAQPDAKQHPNWGPNDKTIPGSILGIATQKGLHWNKEAHLVWNEMIKVLDRPDDVGGNDKDKAELQLQLYRLQHALHWQAPPPTPKPAQTQIKSIPL